MVRLSLLCTIILFSFSNTLFPMRRATGRVRPVLGRGFSAQAQPARLQALRLEGIQKSHEALTTEPAYTRLATLLETQRVQALRTKNASLTEHVDALKNAIDELDGFEGIGKPVAVNDSFCPEASWDKPGILYHATRGAISANTWQLAAQNAQEIGIAALTAQQQAVIQELSKEQAFNRKLVTDYYSLKAQYEARLLRKRNQEAAVAHLQSAAGRKQISWGAYLSSFFFF